jgi:quercetin dioxygenase-like cupin family protein
LIIKDVKEKLKTAKGPVALALHQGSGYKTLVMGFNKGMILKEHKAHIKSKLTVLEGAVVYEEEDRKVTLEQYDQVDIPVEVTHWVEALEDSLCLLTQGN